MPPDAPISRIAAAQNAYAIIRHWADATPDAEAIVHGGKRTSYAQFNARIDAVARALLAAGVNKGDRIATLQTPHPDYALIFLAAASIGAIWIGLNPKYRREEFAHIVRDSEPRLLFARMDIAGRSYAEDIAALRAETRGIERVITFDGDPQGSGDLHLSAFIAEGASLRAETLKRARAEVDGADACLIVYTSGSTGAPKGALLHHRGIIDFSLKQNEIWPCDPLRTVNYFPINHVGCVIDLTMPAFAAGGTIIFMEHFDPSGCLALMARERATMWGSVPSVFRLQLEAPDFADHDLSAVQLIAWEGAAMPRDMIAQLASVCPRLATNYGMTETTSAITVLPPTDDIELLTNTVGKAFPGVEIRLVNDKGEDTVDGEPGEVWARSRFNLLGYWRRPDATADAITPNGYFRTGDLAVRNAEGYYRIVGRLKEMYKSGGYNVYPREIESVLESHPNVAMAAVVAAPDPIWQEVGVAFVAPNGEIDAETLHRYCKERLANYKAPKRIIIEPNLPLLPIGKIDKQALKRRVEAMK
jgi:acyl-CoA synthetase (AMP-forming)/AMP-acid ligase II